MVSVLISEFTQDFEEEKGLRKLIMNFNETHANKKKDVLYCLFLFIMCYIIFHIMIATIKENNEDKIIITPTDYRNKVSSIDSDKFDSLPFSEKVDYESLDFPLEYSYSYEFGLIRCFTIESDAHQIFP